MWEILLLILIFPFLVIFYKPKNVQVSYPAILLRTKWGLKLINSLYKNHTKFWKSFADMGYVASYGLIGVYLMNKKLTMKKELLTILLFSLIFFGPVGGVLSFIGGLALYGVATLSNNAFDILAGTSTQAGVTLAIPGVTLPLSTILAFVVVLVVHEFSHGVVSKTERIPVTNTGLLFLGPFPVGAFVEPDDKKLNSASTKSKIRVISAGSAANYLVALLFFFPYFFMSHTVYPGIVEGVQIVDVNSSYPSANILQKGDIIYEINGFKVSSLSDLSKINKDLNYLHLQTQRGAFDVPLIEGKMGVMLTEKTKSDPWSTLIKILVEQFYWIFVLNMAVGITNMFPMLPFDGGQVVKTLALKSRPKQANKIAIASSLLVLIILLINLIPSI